MRVLAVCGLDSHRVSTALATVARNHNLRRRIDEGGWLDRRALAYLEAEAERRT